LSAQLSCEVDQKRFVHQVALRTVRQQAAAARHGLYQMFHSNRGCEAAEKETAWFHDAPRAVYHSPKVIVISREVEYGAGDYDVGEGAREGRFFDGLRAKVAGWQSRRKRCGEAAYGLYGLQVRIDAKNLEAFPEEIDQVPAGATSGIEDAHAGQDTAAEELIEEVDIDLSELLLESGQGHLTMVRDAESSAKSG
jgi:hypothetical protein